LTRPGAVSVALDIQALQVEGFSDRGIGRYVAGYAAALHRRGALAAALLAPELPPPDRLPPEVAVSGAAVWDCRAECRRLIQDGLSAYHLTAPFLHSGPGEPTALGVVEHWAEAAVPRVVTLHDLIPLRAPRHYLPTPAHEERYRARAEWVARSDLILTNSEHTRTEAVELLGSDPRRVIAVGAGVSPYFSPADGTDAELWRFHFPGLDGKPHLLTVAGNDARKGADRAVVALGLLTRRGVDVHLLVAGHVTGEWRRSIEEAAAGSGVADRVWFSGPVSDELLRACYRRAELTVMPSLAEGAGLPVLESAACGTPALASGGTALAETAATPEAVFDPTSPESIADAVAAVLTDDQRRERVLAAQQAVAAASTWEAVANRAVAAIASLDANPPRQNRAGGLPPRMALAGPLPPGGGGIGAYNARLLAALACREGLELDAVVTSRPRPDGRGGFGLVTPDAFGLDVRPAGYDQVVYAIGNSAGHLATVELALRYPGWLWLHEVRLAALATTALDKTSDDEYARAMTWLLERAYPGRAPLGPARRAGRDGLELAAAGVGLVAPLAERCRGLLVNSQTARRLLLLDLPPLAAHPPVVVLPPGCPPVGAPRPAPPEDWAVAFGISSMSKRPDLLVDAAAVAGCRLAFVGPCPAILKQFIEERAEVRGVADQVEVVGEVDEAGWARWLARAAIAVQLRDTPSGETSAAVLEALSAGVPVLTNLASAAEYPPGTVAWLDRLDADEVGRRIGELLASPALRADLSQAGQAFAANHQFSHLAAALVSAIEVG
jgi:glycosyltransferase involved in cell wall biosynthesis